MTTTFHSRRNGRPPAVGARPPARRRAAVGPRAPVSQPARQPASQPARQPARQPASQPARQIESRRLPAPNAAEPSHLLGIHPGVLGAFSLGIAYGGGLWMSWIHEVEGAVEGPWLGVELSPLLHWLRDATLMLPVALLGSLAGLLVARRLAAGLNGNDEDAESSRLLGGVFAAAMVALLTSAALGLSSPLHNALFDAHHAHALDTLDTEEVTLAAEMARHGLIALTGILPVAAGLTLLFGGAPWAWPRPDPRVAGRSGR